MFEQCAVQNVDLFGKFGFWLDFECEGDGSCFLECGVCVSDAMLCDFKEATPCEEVGELETIAEGAQDGFTLGKERCGDVESTGFGFEIRQAIEINSFAMAVFDALYNRQNLAVALACFIEMALSLVERGELTEPEGFAAMVTELTRDDEGVLKSAVGIVEATAFEVDESEIAEAYTFSTSSA